ncbi:hypothetical protein GH714_029474 [Hevea brasiliensis]|uniref:Pectinesterase inhibitor domain-containing protein n=1 Tax=Hevea brasiliensis TaxID=3981 RepID=A0A6A6N828_HEVBR|nr:hypothetical protein GH714_029474 [Hevea brasiliensis]
MSDPSNSIPTPTPLDAISLHCSTRDHTQPKYLKDYIVNTMISQLSLTSDSLIGSASAADVHSLAKSALEATTIQGDEITKKIVELMMGKVVDVVQQLMDCSEIYNVTMDKIKFATATLKAKVFSDVNVGITTAMTKA